MRRFDEEGVEIPFHLESVCNGLGAPSLLLLIMALRKEIPATVSITADTGWELDRKWNTGRRSTNEEYFNEVIKPLCNGTHVQASFVRAVNKSGLRHPAIIDHLKACAASGQRPSVPMFGSRGGRLTQTCTDKWKIRAMRQEARRMGAKFNRNAQGIHFAEADRRVKGLWMGCYMRADGVSDAACGKWNVYRTTVIENKIEKPIKWQAHYYPLVDLKMRREDVYRAVEKEGVPYLLSSECDGCPHKDLARWERTSPEVLQELAAVEAKFNGSYFLTPNRVPLLEAIEQMRAKGQPTVEPDFGCGNAVCGV